MNIRGLPLPHLLTQLITSGRWHHPGDNIISEVIPFMVLPVDFMKTAEEIEYVTADFALAASTSSAECLYLVRGLPPKDRQDLPWLNLDLSLFIAANRNIGDDVGIALDYRPSLECPRVVASRYDPPYIWQEVSRTFEQFANAIQLSK